MQTPNYVEGEQVPVNSKVVCKHLLHLTHRLLLVALCKRLDVGL